MKIIKVVAAVIKSLNDKGQTIILSTWCPLYLWLLALHSLCG